MKACSPLEKMAKGLVLHYLQGGTVEEAVQLGEDGGLRDELLESFPGIMFRATSAAGAICLGKRTLTETVEVLVLEGAPKDDAEFLVKLALDFMRELVADGGDYRPVPKTRKRWFEYEEAKGLNGCS